MHLIFVYGTLKRGHANYLLHMDTARFRGVYRTLEAFPLIIGGEWFVPSLLPEPGKGHRVEGEVFAVDDATLAVLDELEAIGEPDGYHRETITLESTGDGAALEAWVYFRHRERAGRPHCEPLESYPLDPRYVPSEGRN